MSPFSQEHDGSTYTQCDTSNVLSDIDDTVGSRVQYPQFKAQGVGREQSQQRSEENEDDKQEKAGFTSTRSEPAHSPPDPPQDSQTNLAEQIAQLSVAIESLTSHLKEESEARKGGRTSDPAIPGQRLMLQPLYDYDVETLRALMSVNKQVAYEEFRKYFINYVIQTVVLGANERRPPEEFPDLYLCHSKDASSLTSNEEEAPEVFDFQNEGLPHFSSGGKYVDLAKALGRLFPHWSARGFTWLDELSLNKTTAAESAESGSNGFIRYLSLGKFLNLLNVLTAKKLPGFASSQPDAVLPPNRLHCLLASERTATPRGTPRSKFRAIYASLGSHGIHMLLLSALSR